MKLRDPTVNRSTAKFHSVSNCECSEEHGPIVHEMNVIPFSHITPSEVFKETTIF